MPKTMAVRYVMSDPGPRVRQERQRDRIHRVAEYLVHSAPAGLDAALRRPWDCAPDDAARMRVLVDPVALYTERRLERLARASARVQAARGRAAARPPLGRLPAPGPADPMRQIGPPRRLRGREVDRADPKRHVVGRESA